MLYSASNVVLLLIAATTILRANGARILTVFPLYSKSHFAVGEALAVGLAEAGHSVTFVTPYASRSDLVNLETVELTGVIAEQEGEHVQDLQNGPEINCSLYNTARKMERNGQRR